MKKRVLMIIPNLGFGGAQRVFHNLSVSFKDHFDVIECVFNLDNGHAYPSGNKIVSLNVPAGQHLLSKTYFFILRVVKLRKIKKEYKIDYSISHLEGADYVNILSRTKANVILCIHGSKKHDRRIKGWLGLIRKKILLRILYRYAYKIVAVSNGIKKELESDFKLNKVKIKVINNGFNVDEIRTKMDEDIDPILKKVMAENNFLVAHGRLAEEKNYRALITIMADPSIKNRFKLLIIGDGPLRDELITQSRSVSLRTYSNWENVSLDNEHQVIFWGYSPNPFPILKRASMFLFPSLYEGFPMALLEAMICGIPIISSNCFYGPEEILLPESQNLPSITPNGILMPIPESPDSLVVWITMINQLWMNEGLRAKLSKAASKRGRDFDHNKIMDQWLRIVLP